MSMKPEHKKAIRKTMVDLHVQYCKDNKIPLSQKKFGHPLNKENTDYWTKVINLLPPIKNANFLDIGLGSGRYLFSIAQVRDYELSSVEHPKMNKLLKEKHMQNNLKKYKVDLKRADLTKDKLPFKDNTFDIVMFSNVIEHLQPKDVFTFLKEFNRVLKKGGIILIETPNLFSFMHRVKAMLGIDFGYDLGEKHLKERGYAAHIREYTANELKILLKNYGFTPKKVFYGSSTYERPVIDAVHKVASSLFSSCHNMVTVIGKKE